MSKWEPCEIRLTWKQASVLEGLINQAMDEYFQGVVDGASEDWPYVNALADVLVKVEAAQEDAKENDAIVG